MMLLKLSFDSEFPQNHTAPEGPCEIKDGFHILPKIFWNDGCVWWWCLAFGNHPIEFIPRVMGSDCGHGLEITLLNLYHVSWAVLWSRIGNHPIEFIPRVMGSDCGHGLEITLLNLYHVSWAVTVVTDWKSPYWIYTTCHGQWLWSRIGNHPIEFIPRVMGSDCGHGLEITLLNLYHVSWAVTVVTDWKSPYWIYTTCHGQWLWSRIGNHPIEFIPRVMGSDCGHGLEITLLNLYHVSWAVTVVTDWKSPYWIYTTCHGQWLWSRIGNHPIEFIPRVMGSDCGHGQLLLRQNGEIQSRWPRTLKHGHRGSSD